MLSYIKGGWGRGPRWVGASVLVLPFFRCLEEMNYVQPRGGYVCKLLNSSKSLSIFPLHTPTCDAFPEKPTPSRAQPVETCGRKESEGWVCLTLPPFPPSSLSRIYHHTKPRPLFPYFTIKKPSLSNQLPPHSKNRKI
ncbi:hypothetical protein BDP81DRAFT_34536 [Colletotrichum phormii]|uniref:Uncharacterized protein n=1 Tax=Colletotrichum phormii TaxID=359342 RepID=A0AAI9ZQ87_9PEZI|nr:uncharacterized protein BDP81DRAFT_34536 [Colletotrichum phormii]KAK1636181.1 hypothetical protein BDP81DRAFT_34536 [Colletotrichum phormii]